jgi:hypothetical protein
MDAVTEHDKHPHCREGEIRALFARKKPLKRPSVP